ISAARDRARAILRGVAGLELPERYRSALARAADAIHVAAGDLGQHRLHTDDGLLAARAAQPGVASCGRAAHRGCAAALPSGSLARLGGGLAVEPVPGFVLHESS